MCIYHDVGEEMKRALKAQAAKKEKKIDDAARKAVEGTP